MNHRFRVIVPMLAIAAIAASLVVSGCGKKTTAEQPVEQTQATTEQTSTTDGGETLYTPTYVPNGHETVVFTTSKGVIEAKLFGTDAPINVGNFIELVNKGFYNDSKFHRYEPGFVVQGGDPQTVKLTTDQVVAAVKDGSVPLGTGGPGYSIQGEFDLTKNPNKHVTGALGMARSQSPNSAGSQFYFTLADASFLDGQYTVFGQVTKGLDVMKSLRVGDVIEKVEIHGATD